MIRILVLYPSGPGKKFDFDYYINKHLVAVHRRWDPLGMIRIEVDKGLGTAQPGAAAPFVAVGHVYFNSLQDFQKAFSAHGAELVADIPNYTDIQPQFQISEIVK